MTNLIKIEELAMFLLGIYLFSLTEYSWWLFPILILVPDMSMLGYVLNNKAGAFLYNLFHHKGVAIIFYFLGILFKIEWIQLCGIILFSHSCMDRILGYGLKYTKGFAYTHLGIIKKKQ